MSRFSVLFDAGHDSTALKTEQPSCFGDLHLDEVLAEIQKRSPNYNLSRLFCTPLASVDAVALRQEVFRDLEVSDVAGGVRRFVDLLGQVRALLARMQREDNAHAKDGLFLAAAGAYVDAVRTLNEALALPEARSRLLNGFSQELAKLAESERHARLASRHAELVDRLSKVRYGLHISELTVEVVRYAGEPDYSQELRKLFERFEQGDEPDLPFEKLGPRRMSHVEGLIIDRVAMLEPELFADLARFRADFADLIDELVAGFDEDIAFYLAYLDFLEPIKQAGCAFCIPEIVPQDAAKRCADGFDLALAARLLAEGAKVVPNDFLFAEGERILVVSGPNQGGKTTFARMVGQICYLAALGLPVPGSSARLPLFDRVLTHFEREERLSNSSGKLENDVARLKQILDEATGDSLVILNEILTSTTYQDALAIGVHVLKRLEERGLHAVWVSFIEELMDHASHAASYVSCVDPTNPALRTMKVVRKPPEGRAYAEFLASAHGLAYAQIRERFEA